MAIDATPTLVASQRPALRVVGAKSGVRADAERVTLVVTDALAAPMEGIAACDDVLAATSRVRMALRDRALGAAYRELDRIDRRARASGEELRRMAGLIEPQPERTA